VVGCVANYTEGKGHEALISVAASLRAEVPDLRFVFAGAGPLRPELDRWIRDAGLEGIIVVTGRVDDAQKLYPAFDITVQASASEGLPNAVLEAASAGRPIIATAVGGTGDIVVDEVSGLLVPYDDVRSMRAALLRLVRDPSLRERLGAAAYEQASMYSPERLAGATARLYAELVGRGGPEAIATAGGDQ
jgi:glycosyltransferase involved in cell wall biosynthesis